jgi:hypothetical protein
MPTMKLVSEHP